MDLQNLKDQLNKAGFSEEALKSLNAILDTAIARGELLEDEKKQLSAIIDEEMEKMNTQAAVMEEIAYGLDTYVNELSQIENIADQKTKRVEEDFNNQMNDLEEETKQVQGSS